MEEEFVGYNISNELRGLGFNKRCFGYFGSIGLVIGGFQSNPYNINSLFTSGDKTNNPKISAILYQQAFEWFAEKKGYFSEIFVDDNRTFGFLISYFTEFGRIDAPIQRGISSYSQAKIICLNELINLVKKQHRN